MVERVKRSDVGKSSGYKPGYKKPPVATRFKPGVSGNPKGRPKEAKNLTTVMSEELNSRIRVTENGKTKTITKGRGVVKQVVNKAVTGDHKAAQIVLNETRLRDSAAADSIPSDVFETPEHELVITDIVRRIRLMEEQPRDQREGDK